MCGYGYGANGVWNDLYSSYEDGDFGAAYLMDDPNNYTWWYDGANLPGGTQMTYLKKFYTALDWWMLTPRFNNPSWSDFVDPNHAYLSSEGNTTYVVYFFGSGDSTGTLRRMAPDVFYEASWFNPRTGTYTNIGRIVASSCQWAVPVRPSREDWVLLVELAASEVVPFPANGDTLQPSGSQSLSWVVGGSPSNLSYEVYFGDEAIYDPGQPYDNLPRITPEGDTSDALVTLPEPLPSDTTYHWILAVVDPEFGTTNLYPWSFSITNVPISVSDGSFENPIGIVGSWAPCHASWSPSPPSLYQLNRMPDHFTVAADGDWAAFMGGIGTIGQDLFIDVNPGNVLSVSFYAGRSKNTSNTAGGGVMNAMFRVGATAYGMSVDTTSLAPDTWQRYTHSVTVTNSGDLSLEFGIVSGTPWLDNLSEVTLTPWLASGFSADAIRVDERHRGRLP